MQIQDSRFQNFVLNVGSATHLSFILTLLCLNIELYRLLYQYNEFSTNIAQNFTSTLSSNLTSYADSLDLINGLKIIIAAYKEKEDRIIN